MNDLARTTLVRLVTRYGVSLAHDPNRCEGLLRDTCPQCGREIFVLTHVVRQHVTDDLLVPRHTLPLALTKGFLVKRLEDELGFSGEVAQWAVASWVEALGLENPGASRTTPDHPPEPAARPATPADRALYDQWAADLPRVSRPARLEIIAGLAGTPGPESTGILIAALKNDDPAVRGAAFDALADEKAGAGPALVRALHDGPDAITWRAALVLGSLKDRGAVDALVSLLDGPPIVRDAAIWALGEIGDRRAATPLMNLLRHPESPTAPAAEDALRKIG